MVAVILAGSWTALAVRMRRRDPNWSVRRDLTALGISAAVTVFLALPLAPAHDERSHPVAQRVVLWIAIWLLLAMAIRLITALSRRHRSPGV